MTDIHNDLTNATMDAVRGARAEMDQEFGSDPIHGFALCTDDNLMTLYSAACTKSWVAEREPNYSGIGSIFTEWTQKAGDDHFRSVSKAISELADDDQSTVEQRFECLVLALEACRNEGLFDADTILMCGNTDGVDEMEMDAVARLNTKEAASQIAADLGEDLPEADDHEAQSDDSDSPASMLNSPDTIPLSLMEIIPGRGVEGCEIDAAREAASEVFGENKGTSASYLEFPTAGVEVICSKKMVQSLLFHFRLDDYQPFNGLTQEGIGVNSTVDDVQQTYGKPSRLSESTVSEFGAAPGALETSMEYGQLGIEFTFWDGQLASIRVDEAQG